MTMIWKNKQELLVWLQVESFKRKTHTKLDPSMVIRRGGQGIEW